MAWDDANLTRLRRESLVSALLAALPVLVLAVILLPHYPVGPALASVRHRTDQLYWTAGVLFLAAFLLALVREAHLQRQLVTPIASLANAVERLATGDPAARVLPDGPEPVHRLGRAVNAVAEQLWLQVRRLDEAQAYLDAILGQMPDGLLVLDKQVSVVRANSAAELLLETSGDRMLGRPMLSILLDYALDAEIARALEGESQSVLDVRTRHGRALRIALQTLMIAERPAGVVLVLQDLTELRRADDMRRDFVANVSHELRTPVAAIRAVAETLVIHGSRRSELVADYSPRIVDECQRLESLIRDLLLLAEAESRSLPLSPEPLDPYEMARAAQLELQTLASDSGTTLLLESFPPRALLADRFALNQCLRSLIANALRYAAGGTVRLGGRADGSQIILSVADDGPGIASEHLPRIFERFYCVDKARSRDQGGSGLGLSIVRNLVEIQGGRTWAESVVGRGSTFYLAFPVDPGWSPTASTAGSLSSPAIGGAK